MANVIDVAAYVLEQIGSVTTMKLQKLVYYSQARSLVKCDKPLFADEIQAWANGPVSPRLYRVHSGKYMIGKGALGSAGAADNLSPHEKAIADDVIRELGSYSGEQLRALTHNELPWQEARKGYAPGQICNVPISVDSMKRYYSSPLCSNPIAR